MILVVLLVVLLIFLLVLLVVLLIFLLVLLFVLLVFSSCCSPPLSFSMSLQSDSCSCSNS